MTGASRKDVESRSIKMGLAEEIKNLRPELHVDPLGWFEVFVRGEIDIEKPGARDGVSSQVAIGPCRRPRKGAGIIPQARSPRSPGHPQRCSGGYSRAPC